MRFTLLSGSIPRAAGLKRIEAAAGAVTLIQRFGSAANLNIHLHYLCFGLACPPRAPGGCPPWVNRTRDCDGNMTVSGGFSVDAGATKYSK
jgi:hypothetical protein